MKEQPETQEKNQVIFEVGKEYKLNGVLSWSKGQYTVTKVEISHYVDGKPVGSVEWRGRVKFDSENSIERESGYFQLNSAFAKDSTLI
jgi:hypothetical protein